MPRVERPLEAGDEILLRFAGDLRRLRHKAGSPTYRALAVRAHYSVATLSEAAAGRKLPSLAVTLAYVAACDGDVDEWDRRWREVAAELAGARDADDGCAADDGLRPPYLGLAAYTDADADWFFGREGLVRELVGRLGRRRFLAVFGASGAGKTSVLRAGLLATWQARPGPRPVLLLTPGPHPLEECAVRLARLVGGTPGALRSELAADPRNLHRLVRQAMTEQPDDVDLLLVVDQFEETFTLCRDGAERSAFIDALLAAVRAENSRCRVVLGVRADFYPHCTGHPELARALGSAQLAVGAMTNDDLRRAISEPAVRARCTLESGLLATLVAQCQGQVGVLPLLSHALLETWRRRRGNTLTLAGFQAAGGIDGALARTAELAFQGLDAEQQRVAKFLFLRLTALGEGTEDTKRRASRSELDTAAPGVGAVLDRLAAARLITLDRDAVEITHEALVRCWPRLREWLIEDREGMRIHRQLTEAAESWEALGRDPGALYRGTRLALARDWAAPGNRLLSEREARFLDASLATQAAERAAARRRSRRLRQLVALLTGLLVVAVSAAVLAVQGQLTASRQRDLATSQRVADDAAALRDTDPGLAAQLALAAYRLAPSTEARSGLLSTFGTPYATQLGNHDPVNAVAYSGDGRLLVTAGDDRTVRVWSSADPHAPRELTVLRGHTGAVTSVASDPGGRALASSAVDGTVRLWRATGPASTGPASTGSASTGSAPAGPASTGPASTGPASTGSASAGPAGTASPGSSPVATGQAPAGPAPTGPIAGAGVIRTAGVVRAVAFAPDGRRLASAGADGAVRLWEIPPAVHTSGSGDPRELTVLRGHTGAVLGVAFAPDGRTLASAGVDGTVRLWDVSATGSTRGLSTPVPAPAVLRGHSGAVLAVAFAPNGRRFASAGADRTVRLWDATAPTNAPGGAGAGRNRLPGGAAQGLHGAPAEAAQVWNGAPTVLRGHTDAVTSLAFAPGGETLASGGVDASVRLWATGHADPAGPRPLAVLAGHTDGVRAVAFAPGGRTLATASADHTTRLWDVPGPALRGHSSSVYAVAFHPDRRTLATGSYDRTVRLWDVAGWAAPRQLATLAGHRAAVAAVAFSPDGRTLASAGADHTILLWDVSDRRTPHRLGDQLRHADSINAVEFSPDGQTLATASGDQTVRLWEVADPRHPRGLATLRGHTTAVYGVAFAPGGRLLATAGEDRTVRLWDVADPRAPGSVATLTGYRDGVKSVAFSPDGRLLAAAGEDRTVRVWDVTNPRAPGSVATLTGYRDGVKSVAFSPDGQTLATASSDRTVRLWDLAEQGSPALKAVLSGHDGPIDAVAFSPDGRTLATGSEDQTGMLWETDPRRVSARICELASARIGRTDWELYFPGVDYRPPCPAR